MRAQRSSSSSTSRSRQRNTDDAIDLEGEMSRVLQLHGFILAVAQGDVGCAQI